MKRIAKLRVKFPILALLGLYAYLAFHAFSGSQGLLRWMSYSDQTKSLSAKFEALEAQRDALQAKVDALSPNGLDLDILDQAARETLYVSGTNEITIWLDPKD